MQEKLSELNVKFDATGLYQLSQQMYIHLRSFGYETVELPIIEPADLFLIKAGDQIVDKLFTFEHRGIQLALRPEFTASAAYHYAAKYGNELPIARWQFAGYVFEDDPFTTEGKSQRFSIGAELIGMKEIAADAEIIGMAVQGLAKQSITDCQVTLGHVGLLRSALAHFQLDSRTEHFLLNHLPALKDPLLGRNYVVAEIEKLFLGEAEAQVESQQIFDLMRKTSGNDAAIGGRTRQDISRRLLDKYRRSMDRDLIHLAIDFLIEWVQISSSPDQSFSAIRALLPEKVNFSEVILSEWERLIGLLDVYGIPKSQIVIQPGLIRSWDYYSGIVFEMSSANGTHLGGGGRYDGLGKLLGAGENISAVGFVYYVEALLSLTPLSKETDQLNFVLLVNQLSIHSGIKWANLLRDNGLSIQISLDSAFDPSKNAITLFVHEDGIIQFQDQSYDIDTITVLVNELKRSR